MDTVDYGRLDLSATHVLSVCMGGYYFVMLWDLRVALWSNPGKQCRQSIV